MICPQCSSENKDGAKFCNECGAPFNTTPETNAESSVSSNETKNESDRELEPDTLPQIKIPGVNVYSEEDDGPYDFSPIEDASSPADEPRDEHTETLVDQNYTPPAPAWKSGDTMEMPRVEGSKPSKAKEFRVPDERKAAGGAGKWIAIAAIVVVVLALAGAGASYVLELWGGKSIPDVVGENEDDAVRTLEELGFDVRTTEVKSDDTEGSVLLMDPGAGSRLDEGTEIVLHIATSRVVPEVAGTMKEEAEQAFAAEGLNGVVFETVKSDAPEGSVVSVDPVAGTKANSTTKVIVTIAEPYTIPDVIGYAEGDATAAIEAAGFVPYVVYAYSEAAEGTVTGSDPQAGAKTASGTTVTISIAKSRATELVNATYGYLSTTSSLTIGGVAYEIDPSSVTGISYAGSNTTTATVTATAVTILDGEQVRASSKPKTLTIVWNDANEIVGLS